MADGVSSRADVRAMAEELARTHPSVVAVLFYGSGLRTGDPNAILDLYVLTDSMRGFHGSSLTALAGTTLPPNVLFFRSNGPDNAGFKVAVISLAAFAARLSPSAVDTTLWARFCQPAQIAFARDEGARLQAETLLTKAGLAAAYWAVRLGPGLGSSRDYWTALFAHTYAAELRVENASRGMEIYDYASEHYDRFMPAAGLVTEQGLLRRTLASGALHKARYGWRFRRLAGKGLNVARLIKALFTFADGVDYILWKLERHSGQKVVLSPWQRRHPLLAAPFVLTKLIKRGIVR